MIHFSNKDHGEQIMRIAGGLFTPVTMEVISRSENGVLRGGVIYEKYTGKGGSVIVHVGSKDPKWIDRDMLWVMFHYPFVQLDVTQAFAQIAAKNTHALEFSRSVGWTEIIRLEAVYPDDDMVLLRLRREECRFLGLKPRNLRYNKG